MDLELAQASTHHQTSPKLLKPPGDEHGFCLKWRQIECASNEGFQWKHLDGEKLDQRVVDDRRPASLPHCRCRLYL